MQLEVKKIHKQFDKTNALEEVTFSVEKGEFVSVIGPSGAGKTTLFRILNGAISADGGSLLFSGMDFVSCNKKEKRNIQKRIGTIYQDFCLVEQSDCLQNVLNACLPDMSFAAAAAGCFGKARREEAEELLKKVGLQDKITETVKNLSGGQKQRVAIARALMRKPDIILADEPVASLDPAIGRQIVSLLKELQEKEGITVLMNSHNLQLSMDFSDRLIGLQDGRVVFDGAPDEINDSILRVIYGEMYDSVNSHSEFFTNMKTKAGQNNNEEKTTRNSTAITSGENKA